MVSPVDLPRTLPQRKKNTYPEVIEIPINHLMSLLNVPNLAPSKAPDAPLLHRLEMELPRVLMYVRAELFRKTILEWIRDLIHPLPLVPLPAPQAHPQPGPVIPISIGRCTNRMPRNDQVSWANCFLVPINDEHRHNGLVFLCHLDTST